jgi:hypothetical protein
LWSLNKRVSYWPSLAIIFNKKLEGLQLCKINGCESKIPEKKKLKWRRILLRLLVRIVTGTNENRLKLILSAIYSWVFPS